MARTRGGKRHNSKTPLAAQGSTSHTEKASPANHKSKFPYVCPTCSKGYILRDSFLAHTLDHTREKLRNVKPKRQHQRELRPTYSLSPSTDPSASEANQTSSLSTTTVPSAWGAELGRSIEGQTSTLSPTSIPSVWNAELWRSLDVQTSSLSPITVPSALQSSSSPFPSPAATSTAATLNKHLEDEREFNTTPSSLSSTPSAPKSPSIPKIMKRHDSNMQENNEAESTMTIPDPSTMKRHASIMQDNNNEAEPTIIISDDEEDLVAQISPEIGGNYTQIMSRTASTSDMDITSFKIGEKEQEYSDPALYTTPDTDSALYTTPDKVQNFSYEDSGTSENVSHSYRLPKDASHSYPLPKDASHSYLLPKAKMNHVYPGDVTLISSDDDELITPMKTGSKKKKTVAKRLFSNLPLRQNQLQNGGFDSQDFKSGEYESKAKPIDNSRRDVKEALDKINRLGPIITVTKAKTTQDISNKNPNEAIDKIKQLGPAISFTRLNE